MSQDDHRQRHVGGDFDTSRLISQLSFSISPLFLSTELHSSPSASGVLEGHVAPPGDTWTEDRPQGHQHLEKMVLLKISFLILCSLSQAAGCFRLITPAKWGAEVANCSEPLRDVPPEYVVIIHTAGIPCRTHADCCNEVKTIQKYHMRLKGWCDIAYSFLIGEDGYVYEGRGWRNEGSHTYGYNDLSLGIAFIGTFVERSPEEKAWKALKCFLDFAVKIGYLSPEYLLLAHSDASDLVSPGEFVRAEIAKWPNYKHSLRILNRDGQ